MNVVMPPGFEAVDVLGKGAMGKVYRAWQPKLQRHVAIKTCNIQESLEKGQDPGRLEDEALTIARLNHPHIVSLFDVYRNDEAIYLIMELLDGASLGRVLSPRIEMEKLGPVGGILDPEAMDLIPGHPRIIGREWICKIGIAVAKALEYAHGRQVLHRDVKPANIIVTRELHIKLLDFSIARNVQNTAGRTATGTVFGTVDYMSPEQILSRALDGRTDVYSLGCTLFHAATGQVPYEADGDIAKCMAHVNDPVPDARSLNPTLPLNISEAIRRAMSKSPEDRFRSPNELADVLEGLLHGPDSSVANAFEDSGTHLFTAPAIETDKPVEKSPAVEEKKPETAPTPEPVKKVNGAMTLESLADKAGDEPSPTPPIPASVTPSPWDVTGSEYSFDPIVHATSPAPEARRAKNKETPRKKNSVPLLAGIAVIALVAVGLGMGTLLSKGKKDNSQTSTGVTISDRTAGNRAAPPAGDTALAAVRTPIPEPTASPTPAPRPSPSPSPTASPTPTPRPTPAPTPTPVPIPLPELPPVSPEINKFRVPLGGEVVVVFAEIPRGKYIMGANGQEFGSEPDERPRTAVEFPFPFYISEAEITQAQWSAVMGGTAGGNAELPVQGIAYEQALAYCRKLSDMTGLEFHLPTEAQWEYACRAGTETAFAYGPILTSEIANIDGTQYFAQAYPSLKRGVPLPVKSMPPNPWGLYDMHGNVWEWVRDRYEPELWGTTVVDPLRDGNEYPRTVRGGGFTDGPAEARSASRRPVYRASSLRAIGFRVVLEL